MTKRFETKFGTVRVGEPYWHIDYPVQVVDLTLTPPELDGWGVSCDVSARQEITQEFVEGWASVAIKLIKD